MKKIIAVLLCVFLLCSCGGTRQRNTLKETTEKPFIGIWVSYAELSEAATGNFKENFENIVLNAKQLNATALFVHVRAFCDSVYSSAYFPKVSWAKSLNFDPLAFMIESCHKNSIEFHAWINPYRISSYKTDISALPKDSPVHNMKSCIGKTTVGLYFDPASKEAQQLVIAGVKEILTRYDVDGIHFDDYFYPTENIEFDRKSYAAYLGQTQDPLPLSYFRKTNVDCLIAGVYSAVKNNPTPVCFSVSPAADIKGNENSLYADIDFWCKSGYLDAVIPQLYFGFSYPDPCFCFNKLLTDWINYIGNTRAKLYIGLAPYKLDTDSPADKEEWTNGIDIVSKQIEIIKNTPAVDGAVLFSYSFLFSKGKNLEKQKDNIIKEIKK